MDKSVKKKLIKEKKKKSYYGNRITLALFIYLLFTALFMASIVIFVEVIPEQSDTIDSIFVISLLTAFVGVSLAYAFVIIPRLKKKQARKDFARYDFTPYISCNEREIFTCEYHMCRYTMDASPFDEQVCLNFKNDTEAKEYIAQHFAQTLISTYLFENGMEKSPFFIGYYFEADDGIAVRIEKKTDGEITTLDIYEIHTAEFTEEGLKLGEEVIPYNQLEADVATGFDKSTDFFVAVRLIINFEGGYLSFQFSSRIAEVVKRFNIKILHKEAFDYILNNPLRAFEQTALQLGLKKLRRNNPYR